MARALGRRSPHRCSGRTRCSSSPRRLRDGAPAREGDVRARRADRRRGARRRRTVRLAHLDRVVAEAELEDGRVSFPAQPEGGYGVDAAVRRTALDVLADPLRRPRYGFVSHYEPDRRGRRCFRERAALPPERGAVLRLDVPPREVDAAHRGRSRTRSASAVSLDTVRRLVGRSRDAGSLPMAYAAVYAVGQRTWPEWEEEGLFRRRRLAWMLGDFLWNVDPRAERWSRTSSADLRRRSSVGFDGFHLDQYGAPKRASASDGTRGRSRGGVPGADRRASPPTCPRRRLIFNNVNDFPTCATVAREPGAHLHRGLGAAPTLAHLRSSSRRRGARPGPAGDPCRVPLGLPGSEAAALQAEKLQLATVFSHGGTVLLHGEEAAVLTEAYYVTHKQIAAATQDTARRYFDLAVRYGDLLFASRDLTRTHLGGENEEVQIDAPVPVATDDRGRNASGDASCAAGRAAGQPDRLVGADGRHLGRAEDRVAAARRRPALDSPPRRGRTGFRDRLARRAAAQLRSSRSGASATTPSRCPRSTRGRSS